MSSYLEGCTAPQRDENQCTPAVVDWSRSRRRDQIFDGARTVSAIRKGWAVLQVRHQRGDCRGKIRKISWTQVETGSATPGNIRVASCAATNSRGEFYSIAISNGHQQVESGTKMILWARTPPPGSSPRASPPACREHLSRSRHANRKRGARNFTACDFALIGGQMRRPPPGDISRRRNSSARRA